MNEEQRIKAEKIIRENKNEEIVKKYALYEHMATVEDVNKYNIPYRVLKDYKKTRHDKGYARISNLYPLPGYPKDKRPIFNYPTDYDTDVIEYTGGDSSKLKIECKQTLYDFIKEYSTNYDEENLSKNIDKWEYNFAHLLVPYDFDTFTVFDFYGTNQEIVPQDLSLLRKYYTRVKNEFLKNPGAYLQDEPTYTSEDLEKYSLYSHLVHYDDDLIKKYIEGIEKDTTDPRNKYIIGYGEQLHYSNLLPNGTILQSEE